MDHTYSQFDTDLNRLRLASSTMAGLVERQLIRAVDAVLTEDLGCVVQVLADEAEVNQMHIQTDLLCHQMIAKSQRIAGDLREILALLHMNNDLERIGDEAKKIALKARMLGTRPLPIAGERIGMMSDIACEMLRMAVNACISQESQVTPALTKRDLGADTLRNELIEELTAVMTANPNAVSPALALIFVAQSIESAGHHATKISEYGVTVMEGTDTRLSRTTAPVG